MQFLTASAVAATIVAALGMPIVAIQAPDGPPEPGSDAAVMAEECVWYAERIGHFRRRLMQPYADRSDQQREQDLLVFYERARGRNCGGRFPGAG